MLTDNLHNLDLQLGAAYGGKEVAWRERCIHANDWRAALAVPASMHLLFFVTTAVGPLSLNTSSTNVQLLAVQIAALGAMCWRITPKLMTPKRPLYLSFLLTFVVQMGMLLVAFWRGRERHPLWLACWGVYAIGMIAKAAERPKSEVFGFHEVLHACTVLGHACSLLTDFAYAISS